MNTTFLSVLLLGFFLGMRHATDSDHVIAVATIVSRQRRVGGAALTGVWWGIGHSLTMLVVGGAIILFGLVVPARLGLSLEFCVALMLIFLGLLNLSGFLRKTRGSIAANRGDAHHALAHEHPHQHGDYVHTHPHGHAPEAHGHRDAQTPAAWLDAHFGGQRFYRAVRPMLIGVVHGLAGSAAVALLVLPIIQNPVWAMAYLGIFGVGTIAGMMLITAAIALPFLWTASRSHGVHRWMGAATGALSLGFGLFMVYEIGFVQGLFRP
jgi:ABC-type nickel/cobalt efflux system permease component RcnA